VTLVFVQVLSLTKRFIKHLKMSIAEVGLVNDVEQSDEDE